MATKKAQRAWFDRARRLDDADLEELVETVAEGATTKQACERVTALCTFAPSEMVGDRLWALLHAPPWSSSAGKPFWTLLFFSSFHHRPSSLHAVRALAERVEEDLLPLAGFDREMELFLGHRVPRWLDLLEKDEKRRSAPLPDPPTAEELARSIERGGEAAIPVVLAAWQWLRRSQLEACVDELTRRSPRERIPTRDRRRVWFETVERHDPCDVPRLLSCLGKQTPTDYLVRLTSWPEPDPRIGARCAALMVDPPWNIVRPVALNVAGLLVLNPSAGALETMAQHAEHDIHLLPLCAAVRTRLADADSRLVTDGRAPDEAALLSALPNVATEVDSRGNEDELLAAIPAASPADPEPKLVYADLLAERQDPRAELIQLQHLERTQKLSRQQAKRVRDLVSERYADWVGTLGPLLEAPFGRGNPPTWFEDGFLYAAALARNDPKLTGMRLDDPTWGTVRELHLTDETWPILESPHLHSVEWLTGLLLNRIKILRDRLPALKVLEVTAATDDSMQHHERGWTQLAERTDLRELRLGGWAKSRYDWPAPDGPRPEMLRRVVDAPIASSLEHLALALSDEAHHFELIGHSLSVWIAFLQSELPNLTLGLYQRGSSRDAVFRLRHDESGRLRNAAFEVPPNCPLRDPFAFLERILAILRPGTIDALTIMSRRKPKQTRRLEFQLERHDVAQMHFAPAPARA